MERYNEDELLYLSRQGCNIAKEYLYRQYYQYAYLIVKEVQVRNIGYLEKNDIIQDIMISCYYALETYRPDRYCMLRTYLYTIIRNKVATALKKIHLEKTRVYNHAVYFDAPLDVKMGGQYGDIIADAGIAYQPHKKLEVSQLIEEYKEEVQAAGSQLEISVMEYLMLGYDHMNIALALGVDIRSVYNATYRLQKKLVKSKYI